MKFEIRITMVIDSEHVKTDEGAKSLAYQIIAEGTQNTWNGDLEKVAHTSFYVVPNDD